MKRIIDRLYVGTVDDIPAATGFSILGACKEPLHRKHARLKGASEEGYLGKAMPKDEPEYLYAEREHALYLNLVDARDSKYIPDECICKALDFIYNENADGHNVLIVCNKAESRSPSIALMCLIDFGFFMESENFDEVLSIFKKNFYRNYNPSKGMLDYVHKFWNEFHEFLRGQL